MPTNPFDLSGKVALITGANSGIGYGFAEAIAGSGGDLVIWGRRADRNQQAAEHLAARGGRVIHDAIDVSDEDAQIRGFERAISEMGRIDCVIANAGFVTGSLMVDMSIKQYEELNRVAQLGAFVTLREGAKHMLQRSQDGDPGGSLIATGSLTNFIATAAVGHYAAAKSAVGAMIRNFALELGPHGIRANMICAGLISTEMVPFGPESAPGQAAAGQIPLGRMGEPADLGGMAVYLMSDASRYHSGDTITVDGGRRINGM
jgi:NAD(P)-dependent dehydrogenase (short-subunit alcohol dehydrogenase family)